MSIIMCLFYKFPIMKKNNKQRLLFSMFILSTLLLTSCKKYEDGPRISLRSKTKRVVNIWRIKSEYKNEVSETLSAQDLEYRLSFNKEGLVTISWTNAPFSGSGTWNFSDNKNILRVIISVPTSSPDTVNYTILKLKEKELWLKETESNGDVYEYHYVPDEQT